MERGRGILGTGITSAAFHIGGKYPSLIEALKIAASGWQEKVRSLAGANYRYAVWSRSLEDVYIGESVFNVIRINYDGADKVNIYKFHHWQ